MKSKAIKGLSNAEYHALPSMSKSGLDLIRRAPAIYKARKETPQPTTPAMRMGTMVHTAILEPENLKQYITAPAIDRRTKKGKEDYEAFLREAEGKEIVEAHELEKLEAIRKAVCEHVGASKALSMMREAETSLFWTDKETGVECRCRPDGILTNGLIIDIKTTKDARQEEFAKSIANYRYHVQAAFYMDGYLEVYGEKPKGFMFLVVETEPPHLVACYVASEMMVIRGRAEYGEDLRTYKQCLETDTWPGLSDEPLVIDLPKWA